MSILQRSNGIPRLTPRFRDYCPDGKVLTHLRHGMIARDAITPQHVASLLGFEEGSDLGKVTILTTEIKRLKTLANSFYLAHIKHSMLHFAREVDMTLPNGDGLVQTFADIGCNWQQNATWEEAEKVFHVITGHFDLQPSYIEKLTLEFMALHQLAYICVKDPSKGSLDKKGRPETCCLESLASARRNDCVGYILNRGARYHGLIITRKLPRLDNGAQSKRRTKGKFMREFVKMTTSNKVRLIFPFLVMKIDLEDPYGVTQPIGIPNGKSNTEEEESDLTDKTEEVIKDKEENSDTVSLGKLDGKLSMKTTDQTALISLAQSSVRKGGSTSNDTIVVRSRVKEHNLGLENKHLKQRVEALENTNREEERVNLKNQFDAATKKSQDKKKRKTRQATGGKKKKTQKPKKQRKQKPRKKRGKMTGKFDSSESESNNEEPDESSSGEDEESTEEKAVPNSFSPVNLEEVEVPYELCEYEYNRLVRIHRIQTRMFEQGIIKEQEVPDTPVRPEKFRELTTSDDSDDLSDNGSNINDDEARKPEAVIMDQAPEGNDLICDADDSDDPDFEYEMVAITNWEVRKGKAWFEIQWNNGKREPGEYKSVMVDDKIMLNAYLAKNKDAQDFCVKYHKHRQAIVYKKGINATTTKTGATATTTKLAIKIHPEQEKIYVCPEKHDSRISYTNESNGGYFQQGGKYYQSNCDQCHTVMEKVSVRNVAMICVKNVKGCHAIVCWKCFGELQDSSCRRRRG